MSMKQIETNARYFMVKWCIMSNGLCLPSDFKKTKVPVKVNFLQS